GLDLAVAEAIGLVPEPTRQAHLSTPVFVEHAAHAHMQATRLLRGCRGFDGAAEQAEAGIGRWTLAVNGNRLGFKRCLVLGQYRLAGCRGQQHRCNTDTPHDGLLHSMIIVMRHLSVGAILASVYASPPHMTAR